ncbi:MAG: transcription termination factor NusA [Candidatus Dojkabacteria bacterium]|nr:transcription termination factor NusA [Candidatus Dojkabacteria bacterium]MDQ7021159.1 transcription termination factor NusA [Candidatus Dojkabacteria bacterium]
MAEQTDILAAIKQIAAERKIDPEEIIEAIRQAIKYGFKSEYDENLDLLHVDLDPAEGFIAVYVEKQVVKKVSDADTEVSLEDAKKISKTAKVGGTIKVDITPSGDFGRIAAQTAKQVILQKLSEAEKDSAIREVEDRVGQIDSVRIRRIIDEGSVLCELGRAKAIMPKEERVPTEFYKIGTTIKVLIKSIEEDVRGKFVLISRSDPDLLRELFRMEVPEIDSETVEIMSIAREAGFRSKVAVKSNSDGIDPIGSCVGQKGARINAIMNELKLGRYEEKVDIILWDEDIVHFLNNSISPAEAISVNITNEDDREAIITVPNDQYSLAIGKEGLNAKLAAKLTGWKIDIQAANPESLGSNDENSEEMGEDSEEEGTENEASEENTEETNE